jgi:hypothetical protein
MLMIRLKSAAGAAGVTDRDGADRAAGAQRAGLRNTSTARSVFPRIAGSRMLS